MTRDDNTIGDGITIFVSQHTPQATAATIPAFPWVQYHTGLVAYEEALIEGQYFVVNWSAMGRPSSRERIWGAFSGNVATARPVRARQHAFLIEVDGQRLADRWTWGGEKREALTHGQALTVELHHRVRPVTVRVCTELDGTPFLVRWLEITNTGDRPAAFASVYPWSGMVWLVEDTFAPTRLQTIRPFELGRFSATSLGMEGQFVWATLPSGGLHLENLQGLSGFGPPCFVLRNAITGESIIGHFAYSGNWGIEFYNDLEHTTWPLVDPAPSARLYARIGLAGPAPLRVLEAGETVRTPAVHLGHFYGDLDTGVQALHAHLRRSVVPVQTMDRAHPVECNHTGYTSNRQITEEQLIAEVDLAADIGVELFTVDAGWFGDPSRSWDTQMGDWQESSLLPRGLAPVFERARSHGMRCGLWTPIELVASASSLRATHPEWLMTRRGELIDQLDLTLPGAAQFAEETIVRLVEAYQLDCFRLDYGGPGEGGEVEHAGFVESTMWQYYEVLYAILDRVRRRFPHLLLENCASGAGRSDLGMMRRCHWTQISDNWSPAPALKILNGVTLALPPEQCMPLLGAISLGTADLDFMLRIGLFGHFCVSGVFPTMDARHLLARERWRHTIDLYKTVVRPMLSTCRVFHHTPVQQHNAPGEWCVLEYAAPDGARAYAGLFRLVEAASDTYLMRLRGLDMSRRYRVTSDNTGQRFEVDGHYLSNEGLHVRVPGALQSELLLFEALGEWADAP